MRIVNAATRLITLLAAQRVIELLLAKRNTAKLLARGAYEVGAGHYPTMVALHATWLTTLWMLGRKRKARMTYVIGFAVLQLARLWVLQTLGDRWTTRIVMLAGAPLVTTGPYRFVRHPNYLVVALELPCVSLALGLRAHAAIFGVMNLAMLGWRIRAEDRAYAGLNPAGANNEERRAHPE